VIPQSGQKAEIEDWSISGPVDGNALPLARIEPTYPNRAASRGIEGFVIVEFDVSETGQVINAFVLGAEPPAVFNRAALRAIERWKYNPRIVNGKAVKMTGLRTRFSFSLRE
jgi:protein TonB